MFKKFPNIFNKLTLEQIPIKHNNCHKLFLWIQRYETHLHLKTSWWFQPIWKILVKIGNLPQIGVNINNIWNHYLENPCVYTNQCFKGSFHGLLQFPHNWVVFHPLKKHSGGLFSWTSVSKKTTTSLDFWGFWGSESLPNLAGEIRSPLATIIAPPKCFKVPNLTGGVDHHADLSIQLHDLSTRRIATRFPFEEMFFGDLWGYNRHLWFDTMSCGFNYQP